MIVKTYLDGNKSLVIDAHYKPHELDTNSFEKFSESLEKVKKMFANILLARDLNLPKMDWESGILPAHPLTVKASHSTDRSLKPLMMQS